MSVDRYPITKDQLSGILALAFEDWASDICYEHVAPDDAYNRQAVAVLDHLRQLSIGVEPVGIKELADRVGTTRKTVDTWRERPGAKFPSPRWVVGGRPAWDWCDIEEWGVATGRLREGRWVKPGEMVTP